MRRSGKRGFTLIEVLVVLVIISVMAALLFPVLSKAKEGARRTGCLANQRQIALALQMYAQNCNGIFPYLTMDAAPPRFPRDYQTGRPVSGELITRLNSYTRNKRIFYCTTIEVYNVVYRKNYNHLQTYEYQSNPELPFGSFTYIGYYYWPADNWCRDSQGADHLAYQNGNPRRVLLQCIGGFVDNNWGEGTPGKNEGVCGHGKCQGIYTFADCHVKFIKHYNYPYKWNDVAADPNPEERFLTAKWEDQ